MRQWQKEVGVKAGFKPGQMQLLSGSIGEESVIEITRRSNRWPS